MVAAEDGPRYSVIVPARNAAGTLGECLGALVEQSVARDDYEVLVVDDGSTDRTTEVAGHFPVRLLHQSPSGPASARNLGARQARGELLLFTDADCAPTPTWIEDLVRPLEADHLVVAAKGAYRTRQRSLLARFAQAELEEKYGALRRTPCIDFIDTYSAAFRRDAFWEAGGFDPAFPAASNEDTQLGFDLAARGYRLVFADDAIVYHRHSESLGVYLRRKWRHGYWRVRVFRRHPGKLRGDNYTSRSMQLQFLTMFLTLVLAAIPRARVLALLSLASFVLTTLPVTLRARRHGVEVAAVAPVMVFLRTAALGVGLTFGLARLVEDECLAYLIRRRSRESEANL